MSAPSQWRIPPFEKLNSNTQSGPLSEATMCPEPVRDKQYIKGRASLKKPDGLASYVWTLAAFIAGLPQDFPILIMLRSVLMA